MGSTSQRGQLHINVLACPAESNQSRRDNQSMGEGCWSVKGVKVFRMQRRAKVDSAGSVTLPPGTGFLHINGASEHTVQLPNCMNCFTVITWIVVPHQHLQADYERLEQYREPRAMRERITSCYLGMESKRLASLPGSRIAVKWTAQTTWNMI